MSFPNVIFSAPEGSQFETQSTQDWPLGTLMILQDGRWFRYVENGGTAAVAGSLYQSEVPGANFDELAVQAAAAAGDTSVSFTNGATAISADDFKEGFMNIEDDAGEGRLYKLGAHDAVATSATGTMNLEAPSSIQVALTTSTTIGLTKNPYKDIIIHPSPPTALVVGVAVSAIAANEFGWVQTRGPCSVLTDGTVVIRELVVASDGVDGAVEPADNAITDGTPPTGHGELTGIGKVMEVAADTEHSLVFLTID